MVIQCNTPFEDPDNLYQDVHFSDFSFDLSTFQKWAIRGIVEGGNVLVTAHTGSGKTLPAEFAIRYFTMKGKKVIYTTPIKALSNQKLHEFSRKFPNLTVGLLTGDCKYNPEADILIMTTEILRNHLFREQVDDPSVKTELDFQINVETELGCVVFDEVHYIADPDRGSVWEQSILMLPNHVQMVMLSATIHKPEEFASWIEEKKETPLFLCSTYDRVVPLTHYAYITAQDSFVEQMKNKDDKQFITDNVNRFMILKDHQFQESTYQKLKKMHSLIQPRYPVARKFVLNQLCRELKKREMLPALCFVFSRRQVEVCASEIEISLFDEHDQTPSIISHECKQMMVNKFTNWREYVNLPEYTQLVKLLERGIAIHHAGIMPVFREMVELLYEKKYIKMLFATETFAVGLNMPTKTVLFSSLTKFNGTIMRELYSNEYTQMAGRAGRRGIDTVGHVIHCSNLMNLPTKTEYATMLTGEPKKIVSSFKINYHLMISILNTNDFSCESPWERLSSFVENSMMHDDIQTELQGTNKQLYILNTEYNEIGQLIKLLKTPEDILMKYHDTKQQYEFATNKKKKQLNRQVRELENEYRGIVADMDIWKRKLEKQGEISVQERNVEHTSNYINNTVKQVVDILINEQFVDGETWCATTKGIIMSYIHEMHGLAFAELYNYSEGFNELNSAELCGFFICFADVKVPEDIVCYNYKSENKLFEKLINRIKVYHDKYYNEEVTRQINTGANYQYQYDMVNAMISWYNASSEEECMLVIRTLKNEQGVFIGDFIKAVLKVQHIVNEMDKIAGLLNNVSLQEKLSTIGPAILKHVVTNQSLYV